MTDHEQNDESATRRVGSPRATRPSASSDRTETDEALSRAVASASDFRHVASSGLRRYRVRKLLGQGGMGEVYLTRDDRIGRSVAMKVMHEADTSLAEAHRRFMREARVQGQLEHPGIVPVYDLDEDGENRAFFVMKRIDGVTLEDVLRKLRMGDSATRQKYSQRKLLTAFQQVCLALDYAHARGVVHRDVKPSNLMLGEFGEVYVLDWGVAKVLGVDGPEPSGSSVHLDDESESTRSGDVLGTVGYMSPEQMVDSATVDARADVYSLGAVLFRILSLEPLHVGKAREKARSTQVGVDARPSRRAPRLATSPELDAVCVTATALDPADRYESARALNDAVERYLEGDRDLQLRADLAERHVAAAKSAAAQALVGGATATEQRKLAVREAGRALALMPDDPAAAAVIARLMLEPPKEIPEEVRAEADALNRREVRRGAAFGGVTLVGFALLAVLMVTWSGLRSLSGLLLIVIPVSIAAVHCFYLAWAGPRHLGLHAIAVSVAVCTSIAAVSGVAGSLFLMPLYALAFAVVATSLSGLGRHRLVMIALACLAMIAPLLAELLGLVPPAYHFEDGAVTIIPHLVVMDEAHVRTALSITNLATLISVCFMLYRYGSVESRSREQLQLLAWHLRQLAPEVRGEHESLGSENQTDPVGDPRGSQPQDSDP